MLSRQSSALLLLRTEQKVGQVLLQGKYKMTMGLEPMEPMDWIEIDDSYEEEMALRRQLIKEKRSIVIHSTPGVSFLSISLRITRLCLFWMFSDVYCLHDYYPG